MRIAILLCSMICSGCATTLSTSGLSVREADEKMVTECRFLGSVQGSSGFGNVAASVGMQNAKNQAIERAAGMGATHIVFGDIRGGYSPSVQGRAYTCK